MINSLLTFGAKSVNPEILEQTLTVRKEVVDEIEKNCINKTINHSTYQSLLIAPRGSGKTHIIKVLYHRLNNNKKISAKSVIAYMSEDEVGIANFTDLMVSILMAFKRYNEAGSEALETQITEASLITDISKREIFVKDILNGFAKKRIIILLIENFDKILKALGTSGQGSLRDFIHQYNNISIIATSQNLITNLQDSKSPFYNFFNVSQLNKLNYEETLKFLESIAKTEDNTELLDEITKPALEGKLRAIYELTEGNHRLLVTFYSFLKTELKTELSDTFIKVMNDLKPYYEQFVTALPPQQQKIVKHLSLKRGAVSGKEIARACFIEPNVFSKQISLLFEKGMIDKNKSGKDVFYELKEPLMRICFEIGENPNGISKLFVDFLSAYYDRQVIREKYLKYRYGARFQSDEIKCKFESEAIMYNMALNDTEREEISLVHEVLDKIESQTELDSRIKSLNSGLQNKTELFLENFKNGNIYAKKEQYIEAIKSYQKASKIYPDNDSVYCNIGLAFNNVKLYKDAINSYLKAIEINSDNDKAYFGLGTVYNDQKQYNRAIEYYQKAIEVNPENFKVYSNLGAIFNYLKQYEKAIEYFQRAIKLNFNDYPVYYNLGISYSKLKLHEKAIDSYQKAINLYPNLEEAHFNMGVELINLRQYGDAIKEYQKAIEINPNNNHAYYNIGNVYFDFKKFEKALECYKSVLILKPIDFKALNNIGNTFGKLKQYEKAIDSYQKAIKIDPDSDMAYNNMGIAFSKLKQYEEAIDSYQKAIRINPDNYGIYNNLGLVYLKNGKIDNAFETFYKGLEIKPDSIYTAFSLLGAYIKINDLNKSKELISELIKTTEEELVAIFLIEDIFYNLFRFGSDAFIKSYFGFLIKLFTKQKIIKQLWNALPDSLFNILINIEDYDKERLSNIEQTLTELLVEYQECVIPLKMFKIGVTYLKNNEKNAVYQLSKEERKLFKESVLDERDLIK